MSDITLNAPKLFDLSGNTALVTGAGSGIGQRIAMGLAQCGADVALLDRRTDDGLAQTADFIARAGRRSIQIAADVTQSAALNDAVARTEAELGALSLAVNAAGIANANPEETIGAISTEEFGIGDNDTLSAIVAVTIQADLLILLSDIDGLFDGDPRKNPDAKLIDTVEKIDEHIISLGGGSGSNLGTGGMATKLLAAQIAVGAGFTSSCTFSRIFQKILGVTPAQYRRQAQ